MHSPLGGHHPKEPEEHHPLLPRAALAKVAAQLGTEDKEDTEQ